MFKINIVDNSDEYISIVTRYQKLINYIKIYLVRLELNTKKADNQDKSFLKTQWHSYQCDSNIFYFQKYPKEISLRIRSRVAFLSISPIVQTPTLCPLSWASRCTSKDRVSRKIAEPFVKCKIRNTSPQKWNKPRHTGWYHWQRSTGGGNRNGGVDRGWCGIGGLRR